MSRQGNRGSDFEERLLRRLKAVVAERGEAMADSEGPQPAPPASRHRRPLHLALAAAAVLVAAAVVFILSSGGDSTTRAFAVEPQKGGSLKIQVYSLEDAAGLEAALKRAGIPAQIDWLKAQTTCAERHLKPASARTSMGGRIGGSIGGVSSGPLPGLTIGVMTPEQYRAIRQEFRHGELTRDQYYEALPNFSLDPASFRPGESLVIVGSPEPYGGDPEGGYRAQVDVVEGPVAPCRPVPEAAGTIGAITVAESNAEAAAEARAAVPARGQFLYTKTELVQLESWEPNGRGTGPKDHPRHFTSRVAGPGGHRALVPSTKEVWTAPDGRTHVRETLGQIEFLKPADRRLWEAAGSPPPFEYDPAEHHVTTDAAGNPMKEYSALDWRGRHAFGIVPKLFKLPTEPAALRAAIEGASPAGPPASLESVNGRTTAERLLEILAEPESTPALQAAAFAALGEIPGVRHEGEVTDATGRHGEGLGIEDEIGFGRRVIFDPTTSQVLAESEMVFGPPSTRTYGVPDRTVFRETAYLGAAIVSSTHETGAEGQVTSPGAFRTP